MLYEISLKTVATVILVLLGTTFIVLKLSGFIDWAWWFVTLPLWILPAFVVFLSLMIIANAIAIHTIDYIIKSYSKKK